MKYVRPAAGHAACQPGCCASAKKATPVSALQLSDAVATERTRLQILAMDCPTEARLIEKALQGMPEIVRLQFDFLERILTIEHTGVAIDAAIAAIARVGMQAVRLDDANSPLPTVTAETAHPVPYRFVLSGVCAAAAEALSWLPDSALLAFAVPLLVGISILAGGLPTLKKGWIALRSRVLNIHFLMMLAVIGALMIGQWPEAAMVLFLFGIAERLEAMSLARAGAAVRALMALAPATAWVADGLGGWREQPVSTVALGARLRVRPGEQVPLDGEIITGYSAFNEAQISGESLARDKGPGQAVFAGSINGEGMVEMRVQALAGDTLLARMIDCVRDAQSSRAPTQRFIDRFSRYYTPLVVTVALLLAVLLPLVGGMALKSAVYQALVLLVIACPCALVIATPVTLVSALAAAARHGMLIKGGEALEAAARIRVVAFDKTGTLTTGLARVVETIGFAEPDADRVLALAAALDVHSTHPLALALQAQAALRQLVLPPALAVREQAGMGVEGEIDGERFWLGGRRLLEQHDLLTAELDACLGRLEHSGHAVLVLLREQQVLGVLALADSLRTEAASTIGQLARSGVRSVLLSGDNPVVARRIATECGIGEVHGGLLPQDKLQHIERLQQHAAVAMVGDGVNDAPALARADLGISMGGASDTALQTAAVALMDNRLDNLPRMLAHARRSMRFVRCNLAFALAVKLLFFVLALSGIATLWMAVFADVGTSLLVIANGLRLSRGLER